jgi:hypothetical protein
MQRPQVMNERRKVRWLCIEAADHQTWLFISKTTEWYRFHSSSAVAAQLKDS